MLRYKVTQFYGWKALSSDKNGRWDVYCNNWKLKEKTKIWISLKI